MAKPWAEVANSDAFIAMPEEARVEARRQYFDQVVAPRVEPAERESAWTQFEQSTAPTLKTEKPGVFARAAKAGLDAVNAVQDVAAAGGRAAREALNTGKPDGVFETAQRTSSGRIRSADEPKPEDLNFKTVRPENPYAGIEVGEAKATDKDTTPMGGGTTGEAVKSMLPRGGAALAESVAGLLRAAGEIGADVNVPGARVFAERMRSAAIAAGRERQRIAAKFTDTSARESGGTPAENIPGKVLDFFLAPSNISNVGEQLPQLAGTGMALFGAKAGMTLLTTIGLPVAGQAYQGYRESGHEGPAAFLGAIGQAATEVLPEAAWVKLAKTTKFGDLKGFLSMTPEQQQGVITGLAKGYLKVGASELASEETSTIGNWLVDKIMHEPDATLERLGGDLKETVRQVALFAPAMSGAAHAGRALAERAAKLAPKDDWQAGRPAPGSPPAPAAANAATDGAAAPAPAPAAAVATPPGAQPTSPPAGTVEDKQTGLPLADTKAIFEEATRRPAIIDTVAKVLAELPDVSPQDKQNAAIALKAMEADPKAIFAVATRRPDVYETISKAAAETAKLERATAAQAQPGAAPAQAPAAPAPAAQAAPAEPAAPIPDIPLSPRDSAAAAHQAAEDAAQQQRDREIERLAREAADHRQDEELARQIALAEAAGVGLQPGHTTTMEAAFSSPHVLGRNPAKVSDGMLQLVARNGSAEAKAAAEAEIARRAGKRTKTNLPAPAQHEDAGERAVRSIQAFHMLSRAENAQAEREGAQPPKIDLVHDEDVPQAAKREGDFVEQTFGKRVVYISSDPNRHAEGTMLPGEPNTVFINVNAKRRWGALTWHEAMHALRRTNPKVYNELVAAIRAGTKSYALPAYQKTYAEYAGRGADDGRALQEEEMVADIFGDHRHDPKFWIEVFKITKSPKHIVRALLAALDSLRMKLRIGERRSGYKTHQIIDDVEGIRRAVASAFVDWQKAGEPKDDGRTGIIEYFKSLGSKAGVRSFTEFHETLPKTKQGTVEGSGGMRAAQVWGLVRRLEKAAHVGRESRDWYRASAREILKAFRGSKVAAERFAQLIAITSAHTEVRPNFTAAEKALVQFARGEPIHVGVKSVDDKANDLLYFGVDWDGRKTNNFYNTIMGEITGEKAGESVVDMHHARDIVGHTSPSRAEYTFIDQTFKFVAERLGWPVHEAQAAIWVTTKARYLMDKYERLGWHAGKTKEAKRRIAMEEAAIHYGHIAQSRWSMLGPEVQAFRTSAATRAEGQSVTAEVKPSTKLEIGAALNNMTMAQLQAYQRDAFERVFKGKGPAAFFEAFGLDRTQYRVIEGAGGYDGATAPNVVASVNVDADTAERLAKAWMYVFRQDAVPFFRADAKLLRDPAASRGVLISFAEPLTNPKLRQVFDALRAEVHPGIGFTRTSTNEIAIINFRGEDGKPFLMEDASFHKLLRAVVTKDALGVKIASYSRYGAETRYPYHDWTEDRDGRGLLSAAAGGSPALQERLRRWADLFGRYAEQRASAERRSEAPLKSKAAERGADTGRTQANEGSGLRDGGDQLRRSGAQGLGGQAEGQRVAEGYAAPDGASGPVVSVRPQQSSAVTVVGYHYSGRKNLTSLKGEMFGSATRGEEQRRGVSIKNRIYFYPQKDAGVVPKPEGAVKGRDLYRAVLTNIYDTWADPSLYRKAKAEGNGVFNADIFERAVVDAGYDGYLARNHPQDGGVVLLDVGAVPVEGVPEASSVSDASLAPLYSRPFKGRFDTLVSAYERASPKEKRKAAAETIGVLPKLPQVIDYLKRPDGRRLLARNGVIGTVATIYEKGMGIHRSADEGRTPIPRAILEHLDDHLADPLAVYRRDDGSVVALVGKLGTGEFVAVAMDPAAKYGGAEVNFIKTVFPKDANGVALWDKLGLNAYKKVPPTQAAPIAAGRGVGTAESGQPKNPHGGTATKEIVSQTRSVDKAAHEAATSPLNSLPEPTEAQKEAGNYAKGHVTVAGMPITIENPAGSKRRPEWPALTAHYGYLKGTEDRTGEHIDVFVKPGTDGDWKGPVAVVDTNNTKSGRFDEYKVMIGWDNAPEAKAVLLQNYTPNVREDLIRSVRVFANPEAFKTWLEHGDTDRPAGDQHGPLRSKAQEETPEFKRWFDESVVTTTGKPGDPPKRLYHGTSKDVDFKSFRVGQRGAMFTEDPEVASDYAKDNDSANNDRYSLDKSRQGKNQAARVIPVYLALKNPYTPTTEEWNKYRFASNYAAAQREMAWRAKANGHDGLKLPGGTWVAFNPEQVKSAIGNSGAFDPASPQLLRSAAGNRGTAGRIEWAQRPRAGTWISETAQGRYTIEPAEGGFWAMVEGEPVSWSKSRSDAISALNASYREELESGAVVDPHASKAITKLFKADEIERVVEGWKALTKTPLIFRLPTTTAKTLQEVMRAVDTDKVVDHVQVVHADEIDATYAIFFRNGRTAFVNESVPTKEAYVDASDFEKGSQLGSFLYPAVLNWAKNNGIKLVPDPAGLSAVNTYRRTEQMFSAAMKMGSTEFMYPHPDQRLYGWIDNAKTKEENAKNIATMALTNMDNTFSKVPDAARMRYNFDALRFENADGSKASPSLLLEMASEDNARRWGIGTTTIARAIFTHSLIKDRAGAEKLIDGRVAPSLMMAEKKEEPQPLRLYSRQNRPDWVGTNPVEESAARKVGAYRANKNLKERIAEVMPLLSRKFKQGLFDQFAPLRELDFRAYMLARMSKATDGGVEALFIYGRPFLRDGALDVNIEDGGLLKVLQGLKGEHDRWMSWIAGNRAALLKAQGRENLFDEAEIEWLKNLNQGSFPDGTNRAQVYADAHRAFNDYMKSVMDIAEQQGLIDGESRKVWEQEFYVPFYRNMEDGTSGPTVSSGLVNQYAFKKLKGGRAELNDLLANTLSNWSHLLSAAMKNRAALTSLEAAVNAGVAIEVPSEHVAKQMMLDKRLLKAQDEGVTRYFMVDDPFVLDAITSMENFSFGPALAPFTAMKKWITVGVTANPAFKIRNLIRDSVSAVAQNPMSYNVLANVATAWKDTAHASQTRASMLASGGIIRFGTMLEGNRADYARKLIASGVDANTILDKEHKVAAMLKVLWQRYQEFGDRGENVNRAALYKRLRAEGKDHLEASYASRDMLDFSMQGTWRATRFLVQTVPFFNARLQGLYKLGRAGAEDYQRLAYVVGATALASVALLLAYKDDEDWKKREDWDRDNFWWFKVGGMAFRIPKPFEVGAVASFAERAVELGVSAEMTGKKFAKVVWEDLVLNNLSMNPTPQLVKPMIELFANRDFFRDRPIETDTMQKLPTGERIGRTTSAAAQLAGKADVLSPVQIDHLTRAYFGWIGTSALTVLDYGLRPMMGLPEKPSAQLKDAFLVGNFVEKLPSNTSRYVTEFYDSAKKIEESYAAFRKAVQAGETAKAEKIRGSEQESLAMRPAAIATRDALSKLREAEDRVLAGNKTPAEKRAEIDRLEAARNERAKAYGDLVTKRRLGNGPGLEPIPQ